MALFKTLAEAYEHADENFFEPRSMHLWELGKLEDLLEAYGFTRAQMLVATANVYETEVDEEHTAGLVVLHQLDDGFEWEYVGYVEYGPDCNDGLVSICKA
jgi:hypothetical protein